GALGELIIGEKGSVHRSLGRWFTRTVHSTGAPVGRRDGRSLSASRQTGGPQPDLAAPKSRPAGEPQPRRTALSFASAIVAPCAEARRSSPRSGDTELERLEAGGLGRPPARVAAPAARDRGRDGARDRRGPRRAGRDPRQRLERRPTLLDDDPLQGEPLRAAADREARRGGR